MVGPFGEYMDILVRNNSLPKALLPVVELSRKLCWVVRNPCEKERGLEKGGLVGDFHACSAYSKVVGK